MTLKKLALATMICCSILSLAACSSKRNCCTPSSPCAPMDPCMVSGAESCGADSGPCFDGGNNGSLTPEQLCAKRTYYFDFDSNVIHPEDQAAICANAAKIAANPCIHVLLAGHTDPRGSREYNVGLGERRAKAVRALLECKGVRPSQIRVVSYGAERPAVPGHNEQAYALDRRVVLIYLK